MDPILVTSKAPSEDIKKANEVLGTKIKVVVDIEKEILVMGCSLHIDCAERLLENGSSGKNLWGANVRTEKKEIDFVSLINIRPHDNNRSMEIQDEMIRARVESVITKLLL